MSCPLLFPPHRVTRPCIGKTLPCCCCCQSFDEINELFADIGDTDALRPNTVNANAAVDTPRGRPGSMPINGRGGRGSAGAPRGGRGSGEAMARGVQAGEAIINELLSGGGGGGSAGVARGRFSSPNVSIERSNLSITCFKWWGSNLRLLLVSLDH